MERGRGVIFLSAHIGNWEYGAALLAQMGFPVNAIGAEQRDPRITEAIADLRRSAGVKPVGKGLDLKAALSCLRAGEVLAVLLDQDARDSGVVSPFLGFPASTPTGPLKLARKFGSPVLPVHVVRLPDGERFSMTIEPALEGPAGEPFGEELQYAADRCNDAISAWIRCAPEQWLWMYPRWATTMGDG
jgi:KDO2-lipid IV(A) lauroyltransferase